VSYHLVGKERYKNQKRILISCVVEQRRKKLVRVYFTVRGDACKWLEVREGIYGMSIGHTYHGLAETRRNLGMDHLDLPKFLNYILGFTFLPLCDYHSILLPPVSFIRVTSRRDIVDHFYEDVQHFEDDDIDLDDLESYSDFLLYNYCLEEDILPEDPTRSNLIAKIVEYNSFP